MARNTQSETRLDQRLKLAYKSDSQSAVAAAVGSLGFAGLGMDGGTIEDFAGLSVGVTKSTVVNVE